MQGRVAREGVGVLADEVEDVLRRVDLEFPAHAFLQEGGDRAG